MNRYAFEFIASYSVILFSARVPLTPVRMLVYLGGRGDDAIRAKAQSFAHVGLQYPEVLGRIPSLKSLNHRSVRA